MFKLFDSTKKTEIFAVRECFFRIPFKEKMLYYLNQPYEVSNSNSVGSSSFVETDALKENLNFPRDGWWRNQLKFDQQQGLREKIYYFLSIKTEEGLNYFINRNYENSLKTKDECDNFLNFLKTVLITIVEDSENGNTAEITSIQLLNIFVQLQDQRFLDFFFQYIKKFCVICGIGIDIIYAIACNQKEITDKIKPKKTVFDASLSQAIICGHVTLVQDLLRLKDISIPREYLQAQLSRAIMYGNDAVADYMTQQFNSNNQAEDTIRNYFYRLRDKNNNIPDQEKSITQFQNLLGKIFPYKYNFLLKLKDVDWVDTFYESIQTTDFEKRQIVGFLCIRTEEELTDFLGIYFENLKSQVVCSKLLKFLNTNIVFIKYESGFKNNSEGLTVLKAMTLKLDQDQNLLNTLYAIICNCYSILEGYSTSYPNYFDLNHYAIICNQTSKIQIPEARHIYRNLRLATFLKHSQVLNKILSLSNVLSKTAIDKNFLYHLAYIAVLNRDLECLQILKDYSNNDKFFYKKEKSEICLLTLACQNNAQLIIKYILEFKVSTHQMNKALQYAQEDSEMKQILEAKKDTQGKSEKHSGKITTIASKKLSFLPQVENKQDQANTNLNVSRQ